MANSSDPKSFAPYTAKAPAMIQIVGGLLWLGAAGLIIFGLLELLVNTIQGIIFLAVAVFVIITAKSLFKMKKVAFKNSIILGIILLGIVLYGMATNIKGISYSSFISPIVLLLVAFYYRNRFVN